MGRSGNNCKSVNRMKISRLCRPFRSMRACLCPPAMAVRVTASGGCMGWRTLGENCPGDRRFVTWRRGWWWRGLAQSHLHQIRCRLCEHTTNPSQPCPPTANAWRPRTTAGAATTTTNNARAPPASRAKDATSTRRMQVQVRTNGVSAVGRSCRWRCSCEHFRPPGALIRYAFIVHTLVSHWLETFATEVQCIGKTKTSPIITFMRKVSHSLTQRMGLFTRSKLRILSGQALTSVTEPTCSEKFLCFVERLPRKV
mmetsp:Transcript_19853/g.37878  ORF Transcript_19853/g.37878 Transcript_19853/m.37878 type:complete len:255 (+) Transcript_19853:96-860(+)